MHVAIIMDGNGRWAKSRNKLRLEGHRAGLSVAKDIAEFVLETPIKALTLYAFSQDNWDRPKEEVDGIFELLVKSMEGALSKLSDSGVKISFIGSRENLPAALIERIQKLEAEPIDSPRLELQIAFNYSGRWDIVNAAQLAASKYNTVTQEGIEEFLSTAHLPQLDLLIRTGGEERLSDYLLWQAAYTELYFTDRLWPDFTKEDLNQALKAYSVRERRFGKTSEQL